MKEYKREYPAFSLCGLNCGLCPRFQMDTSSKCPGCGGPEFHLQHPSCAVITCNQKHDHVQYCFQCSSYPCERYTVPSEVDSFISYKNVLPDFNQARQLGVGCYKAELDRKIDILELLLKNYNDGRRKNFYCLAVNLLELKDLEEIVQEIDRSMCGGEYDSKARVQRVVSLFGDMAKKRGVDLRLRKRN